MRPLVIACGAIAVELRAVLRAAALDGEVEVTHLPSHLHNTPERIPGEVRRLLDDLDPDGRRTVLVAYADCGTGGLLDAVLAHRPSASRLPGAHCYEFFAGSDTFATLHAAEPGTFYLTDFLARHFDALVWQGLGLDRHPALRDTYFGNYRRVVLLSQGSSAATVAAAERAAAALALPLEHHHTGLGPLAASVRAVLPTSGRH